jgi:hypothetical protein
LYWNQSGRGFQRDTLSPITVDSAATYGLSWADFDNDGDPDLYVTNIARSDINRLYRNDNKGRFTSVLNSHAVLLSRGPSKGQTWGDFDNDADLDLFVANGTENYSDVCNFLFENDDVGDLTRVYPTPLTLHSNISAGTAAADFDNDGDLDLFVCNWGGLGEQNILYLNRTVADHSNWLELDLRGTSSNSYAVGAKARIMYGDVKWQTRWVGTVTGFGSQSTYTIHFGLGDAAQVDSLVVLWPSGSVERFVRINANQRYRLTEGGSLEPVAD